MEDLANKSRSNKRKREEEEVIDLEEIEDDLEDEKSAQIKARKITPCIITFVQNSLDANMQIVLSQQKIVGKKNGQGQTQLKEISSRIKSRLDRLRVRLSQTQTPLKYETLAVSIRNCEEKIKALSETYSVLHEQLLRQKNLISEAQTKLEELTEAERVQQLQSTRQRSLLHPLLLESEIPTKTKKEAKTPTIVSSLPEEAISVDSKDRLTTKLRALDKVLPDLTFTLQRLTQIKDSLAELFGEPI
jgi:hypothetical protein